MASSQLDKEGLDMTGNNMKQPLLNDKPRKANPAQPQTVRNFNKGFKNFTIENKLKTINVKKRPLKMALSQLDKKELDITGKNVKQPLLNDRPRKANPAQPQSVRKLNEGFKNLSIDNEQKTADVKKVDKSNSKEKSKDADTEVKSEQASTGKKKKKKPRKADKKALPPTEAAAGIKNLTPSSSKELKDSDVNALANSSRKEEELNYEGNVIKHQIYTDSALRRPIKKTERAEPSPKSKATDPLTSSSKDNLEKEQNMVDSNSELETSMLSQKVKTKNQFLNSEPNRENSHTVNQNPPERAMRSPPTVAQSVDEDNVQLTVWPAPARPNSADSKQVGDSVLANLPRIKHTPVKLKPVTVILSRADLALFKQQNVTPLKHINPSFPRAMFHCRLCSFHLSRIPEIHRHIKGDRHVHLQQMEMTKRTASLIPDPSPTMVETIGHLIENVYRVSCLLQKDVDVRTDAVNSITEFIETNFPGLRVRTYGSFVTGMGLQSSNVNLSLVNTETISDSPGLIIISVLNLLQRYPSKWGNIKEDFNSRVPIIHLEDLQYHVQFTIVLSNDNAYKTTLLLREYQRLDPRFAVLTVAFRIWARICVLDQPDRGTLPAHAYPLLVLYFMQQHQILPVLHRRKPQENVEAVVHEDDGDIRDDDDVSGEDDDVSDEDDDDAPTVVAPSVTANIDDTFSTAAEFLENSQPNDWSLSPLPLGKMWLDLLKFYAFRFSHCETAVCVRTVDKVTRASKNWGNRRLAVEDPFHPTVNMASPLGQKETFEYFLDAIRIVHNYFWTPQTNNGPLFHHIIPAKECASETGTDGNNPMNMSRDEVVKRMNLLQKQDLYWIFHPDKFLPLYPLPVICKVCVKAGHTKMNCPELDVPKVGLIPPPDVVYLGYLDSACWNIFRSFSQQDSDQMIRRTMHRDIESFIRSLYPDANLTLFGSSCNGFGLADSDVDICLEFESNPDGKDLNMPSIVKKLAKHFRKDRLFCNVVPIAFAKVPIVKLKHRLTNLDFDISLYNQLGRRNSQLLATYSAIDPRVRILGYMAKVLAKQCEIGDASRGSLSSYAYILMVLHYLQQVNPPVIPVLQEIEVPGVDKSKFTTEGWNTWFFEDITKLNQVWPHCGANREPPSALWLGFLLYYAEMFDYRRRVVTIRQRKPLYQIEKMWADRPIAIEDPFDLNHNLGSGLSLRMGAHIRRVFVSARRLFQTPVHEVPRHFKSLEAYLFDTRKLAPFGPPPNDRGCLICSKVGHKAKECEYRKNKKRAPRVKPSPRRNKRNERNDGPN